MKFLAAIVCILISSGIVNTQGRHRNTDSYPELRVTAVSVPVNKKKPLRITFARRCVGKTPIALSREQFTVSISTEKAPYLFDGDPIFEPAAPEVFRLNANEKVVLNISTLKNRFSRTKSWGTLPRGKYMLRIYVNSGKSPEFDYQWLGQTYSNDYILKIK